MFKTTIIESSRELTKKQQVLLKTFSDALQLDKETKLGEVLIDVDMYAIVHVENDKAEDGPYDVYVIVDKDGTKYTTGSESFWKSFEDIFSDMRDETEEWKLKVFRSPSSKREGKEFITCTII